MFQTIESSPSPVLGFMLLGGSVNGAQVRDIRLANELHRRGFPVHVWWIVDRPKDSPLDAGIPQKWLCHSFRYATGRVSGVLETIGRLSWRILSDRARSSLAQRIPWLVAGTLRGLIKVVCDGVEADSRLIRRFAHELTTAGVTHLTGTIEILGVLRRRRESMSPIRYRHSSSFKAMKRTLRMR